MRRLGFGFWQAEDIDPGDPLRGVAASGEDASGKHYIVSLESGQVFRVDPE